MRVSDWSSDVCSSDLVRVSLDDFGTGQASLTHLVSMPVDAIKIDRSFVAQLWPDDPAMVLVQGLIEIARQLNVHVVAEGIETAVQARQLWTMGCVLGQGFDFSLAVARAPMTELLVDRKRVVRGQSVAGGYDLGGRG